MFDRYSRAITYLRISVTDFCNLRCGYCMPSKAPQRLRHQDILSFEEIAALVAVAVPLGIDKVRITGGEPLTRRHISRLVGMLAALPGIRDLSLTTNGTLLADQAQSLRDAGLHRLNISLDAVDPERFRVRSGGGDLRTVLAGIEAAQAAGFPGTKLNCVIEKSPDEPDARGVAEFARTHGLELRFIRRMDLAAGHFWQVLGGDGGDCPRCNRLRLSSDGRLFPCLFGNDSYSIRELGMEAALRAAVEGKPQSGQRSTQCFYTIGG